MYRYSWYHSQDKWLSHTGFQLGYRDLAPSAPAVIMQLGWDVPTLCSKMMVDFEKGLRIWICIYIQYIYIFAEGRCLFLAYLVTCAKLVMQKASQNTHRWCYFDPNTWRVQNHLLKKTCTCNYMKPDEYNTLKLHPWRLRQAPWMPGSMAPAWLKRVVLVMPWWLSTRRWKWECKHQRCTRPWHNAAWTLKV